MQFVSLYGISRSYHSYDGILEFSISNTHSKQFQADSKNTGYLPQASVYDGDDAGFQWEKTTATNRGPPVPTVESDTVYANSNLDTGNVAELIKLDIETGEVRWSHQTTTSRNITPAISNEKVLTVANDSLICLSKSDGSKEWKFSTTGEIQLSPTIRDGTVYVSAENKIYAINIDDGTKDWSSDLDGNRPTNSGGAIAVSENGVFVGGETTGIYVLNKNGDIIDRLFENHWSPVHPTVSDDRIYAQLYNPDTNSYFMTATDIQSRKEIWRFSDIKGPSPPAIDDSRVYVTSGIGSGDAHIYAISSETGRVEWSFEGKEDFDYGPPMTDGNAVIVGGQDAPLRAFDTANGEVLWSADIEVSTIPAIANNRVVAGGYSNGWTALVSIGNPSTISTPPATPTPTETPSPTPTETPSPTPTETQTDTSTVVSEPPNGFDGFLNRLIIALISTEALVALSTAAVVVLLVVTWNNKTE